MTQKFLEDGTVVPVTVVKAGPCLVTVKKTEEKDGYNSIQVAYKEAKKSNKAVKGFFKKIFGNSDTTYKILKEFRLKSDDLMFSKLEVGQIIDVSAFSIGDIVKVQGKSKGKGFQGVVKRHGFKGTKATHGNKDQLRMPGSIGATGPAHVFKGTRMGGHMGNQMATTTNLEIVDVLLEEQEIWIKGALPGGINGILYIIGKGEFEPKKQEIEKQEIKKSRNQENISEELKTNEKEENKEDKNEEIIKEEKEPVEAPVGEIKTEEVNEVKIEEITKEEIKDEKTEK